VELYFLVEFLVVIVFTTKINTKKTPHTECMHVFCVDLRTNSDYFTVQH
jgi:hypothetical protein